MLLSLIMIMIEAFLSHHQDVSLEVRTNIVMRLLSLSIYRRIAGFSL